LLHAGTLIDPLEWNQPQVHPDTTPKFADREAAAIAQQVFGLAAHAVELPSERDQNFLLETATGSKIVLKIANSEEDRAVLEFQNAVLKHVAARAPTLQVPKVWPTREGVEIAQIADQRGRPFYVRAIGWLEGQMLADVASHDVALLSSLGTTMAELDRALQGFAHAAMYRELHWNVRRADLALAHLPLLTPEQQLTVRRFMRQWAQIDWSQLRHGVIHGDANDHNVLVRQGRVVGLIDFGDLVYSAIVCDLAIAVAYAMLAKPQPLVVAGDIVRSYHARFPLDRAELDALYPLIGARLCMSVCYAAYNARVKSGDAYQQVTAGPAWTLLQRMAGLAPVLVRHAWRAACGLR
jgi:Ser/Thr protein kinase RdoA (MazF antagonist)